MYANVIIEYGVKSLNKTFIYKVPDELKDKIKVGMKVYVPFGKSEVFGFVMELQNNNDTGYDAKEIIRIDNEELVLNKELMDVGKHLSSITLCTLITAYQTMLPTALKAKVNNKVAPKKALFIRKIDTYIPINEKEEMILNLLDDRDISLEEANSISKYDLDKLINKKIIEKYRKEVYPLDDEMLEKQPDKPLTDEQKQVISNI